jgi:hypothetical protein
LPVSHKEKKGEKKINTWSVWCKDNGIPDNHLIHVREREFFHRAMMMMWFDVQMIMVVVFEFEWNWLGNDVLEFDKAKRRNSHRKGQWGYVYWVFRMNG